MSKEAKTLLDALSKEILGEIRQSVLNGILKQLKEMK